VHVTRDALLIGLAFASTSFLQGCTDPPETDEEVPEEAYAMTEKCAPNYTQNIDVNSGGRASANYYCTNSQWDDFAWKFGITAYAPNDQSLSQKNFHFGSKCKGVVVWFYPKEDHNNAFGVNWNVCHRLLNWAYKACGVYLYRVNSVSDAYNHLQQFSDKSIRHAVLGGHGGGWFLHWGSAADGYLKANDEWAKAFLTLLNQKMLRHGSIFTDSCLSATPKYNPNLAQYVAQTVDNGLRVIGSKVSFGPVYVTRFFAWNANIPVSNAFHEKTYFAANAVCPMQEAGVESSTPDGEGNCVCKQGWSCKTNEGYHCPAAGGQTSPRKFLPVCFESTALRKCSCYQSGQPGGQPGSSTPRPTPPPNTQCVNKHHSDSQCTRFANDNACVKAKEWMNENCWKACQIKECGSCPCR